MEINLEKRLENVFKLINEDSQSSYRFGVNQSHCRTSFEVDDMSDFDFAKIK